MAHWMIGAARAFRERQGRRPHPLAMKQTAMLILTLLVSLTACSEKPQRVMTESESVAAAEGAHGELRERTLRQGESRRMAY